MKRTLAMAGLAVLALALGAFAEDRVIHVKITLTDGHGAPVEGVPVISANRAKTTYWGSVSDANGVIEKDMTVDVADRNVWLKMQPRPTGPLESPDQETAYAYGAVVSKLALRDVWCESLSPTQASYEWTATVPKARRVRFRAVQGGVAVDAVPVSGFGRLMRPDPDSPAILLGGLPKGEAVEIALVTGVVVHQWMIPAGEEDFQDLGDVPIPECVCDASVQVNMQGMTGMDSRMFGLGWFVTLVSTDGSRVLNLPMVEGKGMDTHLNGFGPIEVPSGTYWISPQPWCRVGTTGTLLRLVRDKVDLSQSGIPRIEIPAGATTQLLIDGKAAEDAILAAGREHGVGPCGE